METLRVRNITGEVLDETLNKKGFSVVRCALDPEHLATLQQEAQRIRMLKASGPGKYHVSKSAHTDRLVTRLAHPSLTRLMRDTRASIRAAAAEIDEASLRGWGERNKPDPESFDGYLKMRVWLHRMPPGGFMAEHRDFPNYMGCAVVYSITEQAEYGFRHPGNQALGIAPVDEVVTTDAGDAVLVAATRGYRPADNYPMHHPLHQITNVSEGTRDSLFVAYM